MIFEVRNGCFSYPQREVLKDVSFSVQSGEILANHAAAVHDGSACLEVRRHLY